MMVSYEIALLLFVLGYVVGVVAQECIHRYDERHAVVCRLIWLMDELYVLTPFEEYEAQQCGAAFTDDTTNAADPTPLVQCVRCNAWGRAGDLVYWLDGQRVCPACLDELNDELFRRENDE